MHAGRSLRAEESGLGNIKKSAQEEVSSSALTGTPYFSTRGSSRLIPLDRSRPISSDAKAVANCFDAANCQKTNKWGVGPI